jgi:hypothetical protein
MRRSTLNYEHWSVGPQGPFRANRLPSAGVSYYEVPAEYGVKDYRYTVVNNRTVLVDPRTHRIVQIIE